MTRSSEIALRTMIELLDTAQWDELHTVLDPALRVEYAHTGEVFDRDEFVRVNRDYPGRWYLTINRLVGAGPHAVSHATVSDAAGSETHHVASFATVADGFVTELFEIWAEQTAADPARRPTVDVPSQ